MKKVYREELERIEVRNAGVSSERQENPVHRKTKVSRSACPPWVNGDPSDRLKGVSDGQQVDSPVLVYSDGGTQNNLNQTIEVFKQ